ncbi:MAG TPA: efflux RND transporter permease subunit, partial [Steroidobacteraceae bacterium]|nr:efflux RND transporter permease subunit [Steroidobacteraceae bacterium]
MKLTDLFVRRPVLAAVISLLILVLGLRAIFQLPVTQFPQTENGVITVQTTYYGADAQTVAGFITQPLEVAIAQAQGIDYLSSVSSAGSSTITATLQMNYPSSKALTEISAQVNAVRNQLPPQSQLPVINLQANQTTDILYLNYSSKVLPTNDVTDYLLRVVQPKLNSIPGVQTAEVLGGRTFALRAWLDPDRMAAHGVTASDVYAALAANNYLSAAGQSKGNMVSVNLTASTDPHSLEAFKRLVIRQANGAIVRLEDVATVVLGAESYNSSVSYSGLSGVFI